MLKSIISHIAIFCLCFSQTFYSRAFAENLPIHTDGATHTQVTQTASGIDQINIAAPNSSGLSHNTFSDYNVNQAGQVINNFSGQNAAEVLGGTGANAVTSTQIGGLVAANENLANSGAARIILNEVTSTNETQLNGYAEIAGTRAELIIANPNGITCSGCGFINTSKFSLIAGSSEFDQSGNLGFNVKEQKDLAIPLITISGLGLDSESASSANIIASSIKLLATIYGGENTDVNLKAGDGKYNYATGELVQNQNSSNLNQELFAVDASNLGAIQAGRIFITATRAGFGVNLGGDIIAAREMDIDAQGNIFYHNISAGENANLTSNRNIVASDSNAQISAPNLNLNAAGEVQNSGNITAYQLAISSTQLRNSGVIQALDLDISNLNLTNSSIIYGENSLKIAAENLINLASGNIFSPQSYAINLTALLTNSGVISSDEQLTISANQLINSAEISAQNNLIISAATVINSGNLISAKTLTIQGQSLENSGQIQSADDADISLATLQNLENATIYSAKNLNLNLSDSLINLGEISAQNNFTIQGEAALSNSNKILAFGDLNIAGRSLSNNQNAIISSLASSLILTLSANLQNSGELSSQKNLTINSGDLANSGNLISAQKATINATALTNQLNGVISSSDDLEINIANSLSNLGEISTQKNLSSTSFDLENSGTIYALQNFEIISQNNLSNSGLLYSENDFVLQAKNFSNQISGQIFSAKNLYLNIAENFTNSGILQSIETLNLSSNSTLNSGEITANQLTISSYETLENSGAILSQNNLILSTNILTNSGDILSDKTLSIITQNLHNSGNLQTNSDLFLTSQNFDNSGSLISSQKATINVAALTNQLSGIISSSDDLEMNIANSLRNFGEISAQKNLYLTSFDLENFGTIYAANNLEISTQNNFNNSGLFYAENDFILETKIFSNQLLGQIFSAENLNLNSSESFTNFGILQSNGTLNLSSDSALNSGNISANQITISNQETLENSGTIFSQSDLILSTKNLTNSGIISAVSDQQISTSNSLLNSGELSSQKNLQISSINFTNSGNILSNEALSIITQNLNNSGNLQSNLDFNLTAQNFENSANLISSQKATINVDALTNQVSGVIYAARNLEISTENNLNNYGLLYSENNLALTAKNFTNSGTASAANDNQLSITNSISNSGEISAQNNLGINAAAITNSGNIFSSELFTITAASLENQGSATLASINNSLNLNLSNQFTNLGQVFAGENLGISAGGNFSNSGSISAQNNFTLSANIFDNSATISADELTLSFTSFNNSGSINSLSDLTINATSSGSNSGEILSGRNLTITALDLNNSNKIHSENSLLLTLRNLTNSQEITSVGNFVINASGAISNSKKLQSGGTFIINADSFTNSSSALTLANGNLSITAKNISNQNTKPSDSIIATGLVSVSGNVILRTDNLNNNSGIIAAQSTSLSALNNSTVSLSNNLGKFISTSDINLNLGDADYAITGEVTASNVDITARNITNSGQVSATDFIRLTANGSASSGNGNITNSTANSSLSAGSYLTLIANRLITNYGTISAETDLTLTSNGSAINNYGSITGGSGATTINAAGSFNNALATSKLTSANNLIFNIGDDLNNYGEISAANDITANVADSLYNYPTALIWSGRDSTFNVANSFINNQADIYSDRNLTIQKSTSTNDTLNKTTLLQNISGNIETYSGNILIKAATLENKRAIAPINALINVSNNAIIKSTGSAPANFNAYDWDLNQTIHYGNNGASYNLIRYAKAPTNSDSIEALIYSGNQISLNVNSLSNDVSKIISSGNASINFGSALNNISVYDPGLLSEEAHDLGLGKIFYKIYSLSSPSAQDYHDVALNRQNYAQTVSSFIKSGGSLAITQNGSSSASLINGTTIAQFSQSSGIAAQTQSTTFNNIDSYTLSQTGVINVDLTRILSAINSSAASASSKVQSSNVADNLSDNPVIGNIAITIISDAKDRLSNPNPLTNNFSLTEVSDAKDQLKNQSDIQSHQASINSPNLSSSIPDTIFSGNFKINFNADPTIPLVESRSQFTDISKFYGSSYYFTQLGFNGDDFIQQVDQLTRNTVRIFGDAYVEDKLISDRLSTLRKDAIFLSTNNTNSTQEIREMINNSVAELSRLGLNATSVAANGLSTAQANSLEKDIITFEVQNVNGIMALVPKIYLSQASRANLLGSGSGDLSNPSIASSATIFGKNSLTINAPNTSLTNSGSIISAGNITLDLASLTNKTLSNTKAEITAGIKSSEINIPTISQITYTPANLSITTAGDIKNIGAKLFAANQLNLTSTTGNILNTSTITTNDKTLLDSNSDSYLSNGLTLRTTNGNISSTLLHNASITAGEININAANNFTNLAASLSAKKNGLSDSSTSSGNVSITSGNNINIETLALRNRSEESWGSKKKGGTSISDITTNLQSEINSDGNISLTTSGVGGLSSDINIIGAKLVSGGNLTIAAHDNLNISAAQNTSYAESTFHRSASTVSKSAIDIKSSLTNIHSELNAIGDISITSGSDTNLIGAKLTAANVTINAGDELNIYSVADTNYSYSAHSKSRNFSDITKFVMPGFSEVNGLIGDLGIPVASNIGLNINATLSGDFNSKSNLNERDRLVNQASNINVTGNLNLTSNNNLNIVGSNISGNSGDVRSTSGDVSISNAVDHDYSRSESSKSKTTFSSIGTGIIQAAGAGFSTYLAYVNPVKTPEEKHNAAKENNETSKNAPKKTEQNININQDETLIASNLNFTNLTINSDQNTNITSSKITTTGNTNISSGADTNVMTAVENDYSYSFSEKKTPSIAAAMSNSVVKIFNEVMPSFGHSKKDNTESNDEVKELVYDQNKNKEEVTTKINIASILNIGGDLNIISQNNNLISGSSLSGNNIALTSNTGATIITSVADQLSKSTEKTSQDYNDFSLNYNRGRSSADSKFSVLEDETTFTTVTQKQSNLVAANNITITSNKDLNILSSNLTATNGATTLNSNEGNVNILALQNTITTSSQTKTGDLTLSAGIGNSHVDTAYAEYDVIAATRNVADAKNNLNHMKTLRDNGQADDDAVSDAEINLTIATLNLGLAELKLAAAAAKSAASASSLWTGFYGDLRLSIDGTKTNSSSTTSTNVASNITSGSNIIINSGLNLLTTSPEIIDGTKGNTTITGSNVVSQNGDITIASKNNTVIEASKDTYNDSTTTKSWQENLTLASSAGSGTGSAIDNAINALQVSLGLSMSRAKSDTSSATYNNATITAQNGDITLTSINDTDIKGANILAQNTILNVGNNLSVESLQNSYKEKGSSFGISLGGGGGSQAGSGNGNLGANYSSNKTDKLWTDNQTSILGTNNITINTTNNTNLIGAVIANSTNGLIGSDAIDGGNLTLNTGSLTFQNLNDHYYTSSFGIGFSTNIGNNASNNTIGQGSAAANNPNQQNNFYPNGSTTLSLKNQSTKKEGITQATIGQGTINIADNSNIEELNRDIAKSQIITKDMITGALDVNLTIDNRLIAATYSQESRNQLMAEQKKVFYNTAVSNQVLFETAESVTNPIKQIPILGTVFYHLSPIEQLAHTFFEKDSKLYFTNVKTGEVVEVDRADLTKNYAVNGIQTDLSKIVENYLNKNPELTIRYNPTHGMVGDLLESGLGKLTTLLYVPEVVAMNRYVAGDMYERKYIENGINLFHSQGTIIGAGAMQLYASTYGSSALNQINNTQRFVAVGPAVLKEDWASSVESLKLSFDQDKDYRHDDLDPVRYLTAPSNAVNKVANLLGKSEFNSPIYIPNLIDIPRGIYNGVFHMESHDVKNPYYQQPLQQNIQ